jgi:hypothetical protein
MLNQRSRGRDITSVVLNKVLEEMYAKDKQLNPKI